MSKIEVQRDAGMIAYEINIIKDQANKFLLQSSIEIGRRLKEAKEMVGHGNWSKWLKDEVDYSQRTASNLIKINDEYGPQLLENSNSQSIANLGYTQAVALLKLDMESRENFLIVHDVDDMTIKEINSEVKKQNDIKESKEELLKQIEDLKGSNSNLENKLDAKAKDIESKESDIKKKIAEIDALGKKVKAIELEEKKLKEKIKDSEVQNKKVDSKVVDSATEEELKALKDEIKLKKQKIVELENELTVKPREIETKQIEYMIPEDVQKELNDLRNSKQSSENAIKFKSTFDMLMSQFNQLLNVVGDIKENEPSEYEKYKGAVNKLLTKLAISE